MSGRGHDEAPGTYPQAPSQEEWDRMTPEERERVVASLPPEVTDAEMSPPEGDRHFRGKVGPRDALEEYFRQQKRSVYVASELPIYYPAARRFAPDLLVVMDVPNHERDSWIVSKEGKGLDFVMEVHVGGDRKKDAERNVAFYAERGIPEYFIYDRGRQRLQGFRLAASSRTYQPLLPQHGRFHSDVLGLDLTIEGGKLRFSVAGAILPEPRELIDRMHSALGEIQQRADAEQERAEEESRKREEEERQRRNAEARVAQLEKELEELRKRK